MKVIQVPMDENLLKAVNRKARASHSTRAALIRTACHEYLRRLDERELDTCSRRIAGEDTGATVHVVQA